MKILIIIVVSIFSFCVSAESVSVSWSGVIPGVLTNTAKIWQVDSEAILNSIESRDWNIDNTKKYGLNVQEHSTYASYVVVIFNQL